MSYTELFAFDKEGEIYTIGEVHNSFRGAMTIWMKLEEKYLPSLEPPVWAISAKDINKYHSRTFPSVSRKNSMDEIWQLINDKRLSLNERIVLGSTFDNFAVKVENLDKLIEAFNSMEFESSLPEQASIISDLDREYIIAVGWNQTSVNCDSWDTQRTYTELCEGVEEEFQASYNLNIDKNHQYLFDYINVQSL